VAIMLNITDKIALHGDTAVWRCYGGKRFSTDIDVYIWDRNFKEKFIGAIKERGAEDIEKTVIDSIYFHARFSKNVYAKIVGRIDHKKLNHYLKSL